VISYLHHYQKLVKHQTLKNQL